MDEAIGVHGPFDGRADAYLDALGKSFREAGVAMPSTDRRTLGADPAPRRARMLRSPRPQLAAPRTAAAVLEVGVAHDYSSGFVKNVFTVHSKKVDYVISKTAIGVFGGAGMILAYVLGAVVAGLLTGKAFDVNVGGLVFCLVSKILLTGVFCALFLCVSVFFRSRLWLTIAFTFLVGMILYPAASVATLDATVTTALIALLAGVIGAAAFGSAATLIPHQARSRVGND